MTTSAPDDDDQPDITAMKVALAVAIFVLGLLSVLAPQRLVEGQGGAQHWFSLGNMAASGVLLSGGLVHMLADSGKVLNAGDFPIANFVCGLTFIGFMVLEEAMHLIFMTLHNNDDDNDLDLGGLGEVILVSHDHARTDYGSRRTTSPHKGGGCCSDDPPDRISHERNPLNGSVSQEPYQQRLSLRHKSRPSACAGCVQPNTYSAHLSQVLCSSGNCQNEGELGRRPDAPEHHHHHEDHLELHLHGSIVATGILMLALSIHSILAGVSIGIGDSPKTIVSTAFAILAHKSFEGFCLGSSIVSAQLTKRPAVFWSLCLSFAIMTPTGILLGFGILQLVQDEERDPTQGNAAIALVQSMCAGTFLYIAIVEIGSKELMACRHDDGDHGSKWQKPIDVAKLICFVGGYLAMSALALVV